MEKKLSKKKDPMDEALNLIFEYEKDMPPRKISEEYES